MSKAAPVAVAAAAAAAEEESESESETVIDINALMDDEDAWYGFGTQ